MIPPGPFGLNCPPPPGPFGVAKGFAVPPEIGGGNLKLKLLNGLVITSSYSKNWSYFVLNLLIIFSSQAFFIRENPVSRGSDGLCTKRLM
jgi:hypothetical protein